jgi:dUTPase
MSLYIYIADEKQREDQRRHLENRRSTDSGVDLISPQHIWSLSRPADYYGQPVHTGVVCAAVDDRYSPVPCLLVPRSSISNTYMRLCNSIGLLDAGYRGQVMARIDISPIVQDSYRIEYGHRLFQLVQHNWLPWKNVILVDRLEDLPSPPDNRGAGGFGSTGK